MAQCQHGNPYRTAPDAIIAALPECQAGTGRHKCAVCAYNEGMLAAAGKQFIGPAETCPDGITVPRDMLRALPVNQGGLQRHTCVYTAYRKGFEAGQAAQGGRVAPLAEVVAEFEEKIADLDRTEALALQKVRIGQQIFRRELLRYWSGKCPLTGIKDKSLLRASHIKPWSKCDNDRDRLSVFNGVLLSSLHDAAFDAGLLSFEDSGEPMLSGRLSKKASELLSSSTVKAITFDERHLPFLDWHRRKVFG